MAGRAPRWVPLCVALLLGCGAERPTAVPDVQPPPTTAQRIQARLDRAEAAGGGVVRLLAGNHEIDQTLVIGSGVVLEGAGRGVTTLRAAPGCDCDVVRTRDFERATGRDCLVGTDACPEGAPHDFAVRDLTIDGGYLEAPWNARTNRVLNRAGSGLRVYGRRFDIDVEVRNVADNALYVEGHGPRPDDGVASSIRIAARGAGKECLVFRGPGDIVIEEAIAGLCGLLPRPAADEELPSSSLYDEPGDGVDGIVIDGTEPYEGNVELGFVHAYACYSGVGLRTRGTARVEADHVVSESNRGGVVLSGGTYGAISLLSVRNLARAHPTFQGQPAPALPGLRIAGGDPRSPGVMIGAFYCFRSAAPRLRDGWPCAEILGDSNTVTLYARNSIDPETGELHAGDGAIIRGDGNLVTANLSRVNGNGVVVEGSENTVVVHARGGVHGAAVVRDSRPLGAGGNHIEGAVHDWPVALGVHGGEPPGSVQLTTTGDTRPFCGECPPRRSAGWRVGDVTAARCRPSACPSPDAEVSEPDP